MDNSKDSFLGYYLIGFFDLLGQSNKLRQLTRLPSTDEEQAEVIRLLKDTAGAVMGLRSLFRDFFTAMEEPTPFAVSLPQVARQQVSDATQARLSFWGFSDSVIVAVPLLEAGAPTTPLNGVYRSFIAAAGMWLLSLSVDRPLRGGIDVGLGIDIDDNEIYGPVIDRAHHLESKIADWPRIAIGDTCIDYLEKSRANAIQELSGPLVAAAADRCLAMLRRGGDGVVALDPLGDSMRELDRTMRRLSGESLGDRVRPAHDVVRRQLMRAETLDDEKLIPRYRRLLAYFDERAPLWT